MSSQLFQRAERAAAAFWPAPLCLRDPEKGRKFPVQSARTGAHSTARAAAGGRHGPAAAARQPGTTPLRARAGGETYRARVPFVRRTRARAS